MGSGIGVERGAHLVEGAVDFYVHASPDPLPRRSNDVELALELREAGLGAALHRHHWCSSVERAQLAREVSGFPLFGAIELNHAVGGLAPVVVESALRQGAAAVILPMLSATHFKSRLGQLPAPIQHLLDAPEVQVCGGDGELLPEVWEIMDLTRDAGAVLVTGYLTTSEIRRVIRAAVDRRVEKVVLTNPIGSGIAMEEQDIEEVCRLGDVYVEFSVFQVYPVRSSQASRMDAMVRLIRALGPERTIVSSDGGMAQAPPPQDLLALGAAALVEAGFSEEQVRRMIRDNPKNLLPEPNPDPTNEGADGGVRDLGRAR